MNQELDHANLFRQMIGVERLQIKMYLRLLSKSKSID